uniref:Secreted protein n=1 Tax=Anopheles darlingi TaxID=43151 RepID=A0A2M4DNK7_ANODA
MVHSPPSLSLSLFFSLSIPSYLFTGGGPHCYSRVYALGVLFVNLEERQRRQQSLRFQVNSYSNATRHINPAALLDAQ